MRDKKAWFFLVKVDKNVIKALYGKVSQLYKYMYMRSKGVAVVRALASHQRGPGLNLGVNAIMWVEFVVRSLPNCSEGFFFLLIKTNTSKFQFDLESRHVSTSSHELLSAPQLTNYNYNVPVACLLVC